MKTIILVATALFAATTFSLAGDKEKKEQKKDSTELETDESKSTETLFEMYVKDDMVYVITDGSFDEYASVSLATNRVSDIYFEFVNSGRNEFSFDTSNLNPGSYYVILNTEKEIRLKRFQID